MENKTKALLAVLGLGGLVGWLVTKKKSAAAAAVGVVIYDEQGFPAAMDAASGSFVLSPGVNYTIAVTANNRTTQGGVNVGATLTTKLTVTMGGVTVLDPAAWVFAFPPGGTDYRTAQFTPSPAQAGQTGAATAVVRDPNGVQLASDSAQLSVVAAIAYAATVNVVLF